MAILVKNGNFGQTRKFWSNPFAKLVNYFSRIFREFLMFFLAKYPTSISQKKNVSNNKINNLTPFLR